MVYDEAHVRAVLAGEGKTTEVVWPDATEALVGASSLNLLPQPRQGEVKAVFSRAFSDKACQQNYLPRLVAAADAVLTEWARQQQQHSSSGGDGDGSSTATDSGLQLAQLLASATFHWCVLGIPADADQASSSSLGTSLLCEAAINLELADGGLAAGFQTAPVQLPFVQTPFSKAIAARQQLLDKYSAAVGAACERLRASSGSRVGGSSTAIEALLSSTSGRGEELTEDELLQGLISCIFGNFSAGPTMSKVFQYLVASDGSSGSSNSSSSAIMARLRQEQKQVQQQNGDTLTPAALSSMPYADAVVTELLRITPAVPAMFRKALTDFELGGCRIPKGWQVWVHTGEGATKYNRDEFQPERWLAGAGQVSSSGSSGSGSGSNDSSHGTESSSSQAGPATKDGVAIGCPAHHAGSSGPPFSLPFGTGPRSCVGRAFMTLQLKVLLVLLARGYDWSLPGSEPEPWELFPAPRPKSGLAGFRIWRK